MSENDCGKKREDTEPEVVEQKRASVGVPG